MRSLVPSINTSQVMKNVQGNLCRGNALGFNRLTYFECLYVFPKDKLCMVNLATKISPLDHVLHDGLTYKTTQPSFNVPPM